MEKIKMTTPLVEMDGDEMTRILWKMIKDNLLEPYIDLKTEYYDLGLEHRNETDDQVTVDSALATKKYKVAVKCATITPNAARMEIWKRFRKCGGIPTGITQNIKDLLSSREIENIFENSDFIYMLNQASGDRQILAKQLNISPTQLSYVTNSNEGEGLLFYGNVIIPFVDRFPKNSLYKIMTTRLEETSEAG